MKKQEQNYPFIACVQTVELNGEKTKILVICNGNRILPGPFVSKYKCVEVAGEASVQIVEENGYVYLRAGSSIIELSIRSVDVYGMKYLTAI